MEKEWTWRDSGNHGLPIKAFNLACAISGYARKPFIPELLIDKAKARADLNDFGDPAYREGLDQLCRSYSADHGLSGFGHYAATEIIVGTLVKRLQIVDWIKTHPEVSNEVISRPWVITGMTRSGTTLGSHLLDLDVRNRSPLHWQCDSPVPPAMLATQHSDPRIAQCEKTLAQLDKIFPPIRAIHPWAPDLPQECVTMTQMDFRSIMFQGVSLVPEYIAWYISSDKHSTYRLHKQLLQIWQAAIPTEYWSFKAPAHMHGIHELMETYPDARLIWSHRDPVVCVASHASLCLTFLRAYNLNIDPKVVAAHFSEMWLAGIKNMMAYDESRTDRNWCRHFYYNDLLKDPVATVAAAYQHFGDQLDPVHERKIKAWVAQRPINTFGRHKYSLEDMGLDARKIREQYAEYIETYHVPHEYRG